MSQKITDFVSRFRGGARANLFRVIMQSGQVSGQNFEQENFSFLCKAATLPGTTTGVIDVPFMGRQAKVPGDRTFADWVITVIADEDFKVRTVFERWAQGITHNETNITTANTFGDYYGSGLVQQLSRDNSVIREYEILQCFPSDIAEISLDWGSNDTISEYAVTMSYNFWLLKGQGNGLPGFNDGSGIGEGVVPATGISV